MKVTVERDELVIRLPLFPPRQSKSAARKREPSSVLLVATSGGFEETSAVFFGESVSVSVNAVVPANAKTNKAAVRSRVSMLEFDERRSS